MNKLLRRAGGLTSLALLLAGCHMFSSSAKECNKPGAYVTAASIPPLKTPPGLDAPDTHAALKIPELNEPEPPPRGPKDPCLDAPPPYAVPKTTPRSTPGT